MKNLLIFTRSTPSRKPAGLRQDTQAGDGITPPILYSEEEVRALEKGVLHR